MSTIAVIGDGGWGTALALTLQRNGHQVRVWSAFAENVAAITSAGENSAFLPGVPLPPDLQWTSEPAAALAGAELGVFVVPSRHAAAVLERFAPHWPAAFPLVIATKGFDPATHLRTGEIIARRAPDLRLCVLSGPSHAEEVARGRPTAIVAAADDPALATAAQNLFSNATLRVYTSRDPIGVELGGALKNVMALALGIGAGLGYGDNARAALLTRGLAEMTRLGVALGAQAETFSGLSGLGDLIVTCTSPLSRNRQVGERLGRGETLPEILDSMRQVAEGVTNCLVARALAREQAIEAPITEEVCAVLHEGKPPAEAVPALLERPLRHES
ncbi:MAG: NAD(P)-dependent glycerol-3-phosphate dehydrogenase [Candidatus Marinimicrobia bacterium]|nr:NAD(P)-dependent glycerol-3-phosphate dehydrogenase [Candidatus Neomarinimicrobiota bacterium]